MRLTDSPLAASLLLSAAVLSGCASVAPEPVPAPPPAAVPTAPAPAPVVKAEPPKPPLVPPPALTTPARVTAFTLDLTAPTEDVWQRIRHGFAVPNIDTPLVKQWEAYYAGKPEYIDRMTARASRYLFYVVEQLEKRGMPTELALLPFVESAYNPTAYSRAHAAGMWQFIPSTGRNYNLEQNALKDERRDVVASTNAALDYLEYLFEFHGDWHLALASYNWGEGAVKRAIDKNKARGRPTDYLSLDMPNETRNYIPKLQAIKNIVADPQLFQLSLPKIDNQPYFVKVRTRDIDIATAAGLAGLTVEEFKALNPSYHRPFIPGSAEENTEILLPADRAAAFIANLEKHDGPLSSWTTYKVKRTESVAAIARRLNISAATLASANQLQVSNTVIVGKGKRRRAVSRPNMVAAGTLLAVPRVQVADKSASAPAASIARAASKIAPGTVRTAAYTVRTHTVRRGETLFSIAQRYGITVDELKAANRLRSTRLRAGTRLKIAPAPTAQPAVSTSSGSAKVTGE